MLGKLTDANPVQEAHKGRGGSKLKKALALQDSLKGAHGEYVKQKKKRTPTCTRYGCPPVLRTLLFSMVSFNSWYFFFSTLLFSSRYSFTALKKKGIITDFLIDLPGFAVEEVAKDLIYRFSSCDEGSFDVVVVYNTVRRQRRPATRTPKAHFKKCRCSVCCVLACMQYDDGFRSVFDYTCCCSDCPLPVLSLGGVLICSLHRGVISAVVAVLWSTSMCVWCVVWRGVDDEDQFLFLL